MFISSEWVFVVHQRTSCPVKQYYQMHKPMKLHAALDPHVPCLGGPGSGMPDPGVPGPSVPVLVCLILVCLVLLCRSWYA